MPEDSTSSRDDAPLTINSTVKTRKGWQTAEETQRVSRKSTEKSYSHTFTRGGDPMLAKLRNALNDHPVAAAVGALGVGVVGYLAYQVTCVLPLDKP